MKMNFKTAMEVFDANDMIRGKLIETISGLNDEEARFQSSDGKWSVEAIVEHLCLVEVSMMRVTSRLLEKAEAAGGMSDGSFRLSAGFLETIEDIDGRKFEAPDIVMPNGGQTIPESIAMLNSSRENLNALREKFERLDGSGVSFPHPLFGPLTANDWLALLGAHEMRHINQIVNLLAKHR